MRVITFSRTFPAYHPRSGEPTRFVEKILNSVQPTWNHPSYENILVELNKHKFNNSFYASDISKFYWEDLQGGIINVKFHTIRIGDRWKVGDKFSPRVWSGKPYCSPQIIIAPDIEVKKVWYFEIKDNLIFINNSPISIVEYSELIARNDGLNYQDFKDWFKFPKPFSGQIICWDENLNY